MELRNSDQIWTIAAITRKWLILAAITPILIVHRLALWFDGFLFPSLRKRDVGRPLFIVGLPRSGTTYLHRLVAKQSQFTTLPLWELAFAPALCEKYVIYGAYHVDRLIGSPCEKTLGWIMARFGGANDTHPTSLTDAEEDFLGLLPFDGCFLRVLIWPYATSSWRLAFMNDQPAVVLQQKLLKRYRGLLVRHLCFRGETLTLVSKNPSFSAWINGLSVEFPNARFMALRRTPYECVPSQLSAIRGSLELFGHRACEPIIVNQFLELLAHYWHAIDAARQVMAPKRFQLIEYQELTKDPYTIVLSGLWRLGYAVSEEGQLILHRMSHQGRQYQSRHHYSLAEFGLSHNQITAAFAGAQDFPGCLKGAPSASAALTSEGCANIS